MALSRLAQQFADEISNHDWSDAPFRADRAGHDRANDRTKHAPMSDAETNTMKLNVVWVTGQVLLYNDPNFNIWEFGEACGLAHRSLVNSDGRPNGGMKAGLRIDWESGEAARPGTWDYDRKFRHTSQP